MSIWSWLFGSKPPEQQTLRITPAGTGDFLVQVVGESHYLPTLRRAMRSGRNKDGECVIDVYLMPDRDNPYDGNAVKVMTLAGEQIGHLSREDAARYSPALAKLAAAGGVAGCQAKLYGGTEDRPNIGAWLDLDEIEDRV